MIKAHRQGHMPIESVTTGDHDAVDHQSANSNASTVRAAPMGDSTLMALAVNFRFVQQQGATDEARRDAAYPLLLRL